MCQSECHQQNLYLTLNPIYKKYKPFPRSLNAHRFVIFNYRQISKENLEEFEC